VIFGSLEETLLGLVGDLAFVDFEKTAVGGNLLVVEFLESGSFRRNGDALKGLLT
jgi:hypothetical protein